MADEEVRINITGDSSDAQQAFRQLSDTASKTSSELRSTQSAMSTSTGSTGVLGGLRKMSSQAKETESRFASLGRSGGQMIGSVGSGLQEVAKDSVKAASGSGVLSAALTGIPFTPVTGAVAALAGGIVLLNKYFGSSVSVAQQLANANKELKKSLDDARKSTMAAHDSAAKITNMEQSRRKAVTDLAKASREAAKAEHEHGRQSQAYADAAAKVNKAQSRLRDTTHAQKQAMAEGTAKVKESIVSVDREIRALRQKEQAIRGALAGARAFGAENDHTRKLAADLARVQDQLNGKLASAPARYRAAAQNATELAAAAGKAGTDNQYLIERLQTLAKQAGLNASVTASISKAGGAASVAASAISILASAITNLPSVVNIGVNYVTRYLTEGSPPAGGGGAKTSKAYGLDDIVAQRMRSGPADQRLSLMASDDTAQNQRAQAAGEGKARASGVTNPDRIRMEGELAVLNRRKAENKTRQRIVSNALAACRKRIKAQLKRRTNLNAQLRKISKKDTKSRSKIQQQIRDTNQALNQLYGEEAGWISEAADLVYEAQEIGFDAASLRAEITSTNPLADETVDTTTDADMEVAVARLTPGLDDDLAAQQHQLSDAEQGLAKAQAEGNRALIVEYANRIADIRGTIDSLKSQMNGPSSGTDPSVSSGVTVNQFFPTASDYNPNALMAAAGFQLKIAMRGA